jgi:hypothetical protein
LSADVFKKILDFDGEGKGNPKLADIDIVDDYPPSPEAIEAGLGPDHFCDETMMAITLSKTSYTSRTRIVLCPLFFVKSTFKGGEGRDWPGVKTVRCGDLGDHLTRLMRTSGYALFHEYTHVDDPVQPPLDQHVTDHYGYGFYESRAISDKRMERFNADSYATFATELTWTMLCGRDFAPPPPPTKEHDS